MSESVWPWVITSLTFLQIKLQQQKKKHGVGMSTLQAKLKQLVAWLKHQSWLSTCTCLKHRRCFSRHPIVSAAGSDPNTTDRKQHTHWSAWLCKPHRPRSHIFTGLKLKGPRAKFTAGWNNKLHLVCVWTLQEQQGTGSVKHTHQCVKPSSFTRCNKGILHLAERALRMYAAHTRSNSSHSNTIPKLKFQWVNTDGPF